MVQTRAVELGSFTPSVVLEVARRTGALADAGLDVTERPVPSSVVTSQLQAMATLSLDGEGFDAIHAPRQRRRRNIADAHRRRADDRHLISQRFGRQFAAQEGRRRNPATGIGR